jgi:hypothetical protein
MDVAPALYLIDLALSAAAGVTLEDAQGTLSAIAPVVGLAGWHRPGEVLRAFGISAAIEEVGNTPERTRQRPHDARGRACQVPSALVDQ